MALIKCESCGGMMSEYATECPQCGTKNFPPVICPDCGGKVSVHDEVCPTCGAPNLKHTLSETTKIETHDEEDKPHRRHKEKKIKDCEIQKTIEIPIEQPENEFTEVLDKTKRNLKAIIISSIVGAFIVVGVTVYSYWGGESSASGGSYIGVTFGGDGYPSVSGDPLKDARTLKKYYQRGGDANGYSLKVRQVYMQKYGRWDGELRWQEMEQYLEVDKMPGSFHL